jgi:hypothetical protein
MKKIILVILFLACNSYVFSQIELKSKPESEKKILITSDISLGTSGFIDFGFDYNSNLFTYGVNAGFIGSDVHVGLRPLIFKNGQISVLATYGLNLDDLFYGGFIDLTIVKHLKIDLGVINVLYDEPKISPYFKIGYCFNLYKK